MSPSAASPEVDYRDAPVDVREDLPAAHRRAFARIARPGTWWSGAARVAIATEVRHAPSCALCARRKEALSPLAETGPHDTAGALPEGAVELVHQVVNDPARLSRAWFRRVLELGLREEEYVEALGVVATVVSLDAFCRALGVPPRPLPEPEPGEPSRRRPEGARPGPAWVSWLPEGAARGPEEGLYFGAPRIGNVMKALSLVPDEVRNLMDLSAVHYLDPAGMMDLTAGRTLDRRQIELVAARVSSLRECFY